MEVFRLHVLEQIPWPALEAQLAEEGRPASRQTLIRRQREALPLVLQWAAEPEAVSIPAEDDSPLAPKEESTSPRRRPGLMIGTCAVLIVAFLAVSGYFPSGGTGETEQSSVVQPIESVLVGRQIDVAGMEKLPAPYPDYAIPDCGGPVTLAMVFRVEPDQVRVLYGYPRSGDPSARLRLTDPADETTKWDLGFDPPPEQRRTHAGVGDEVVHQSYEPWQLFHAGPEGNLGSYVVMVAKQHWSPTFIAFVDIETGAVVGHYVHPGILPRGLVVDVNDDGRQDIVLGGCDNAVDRPVVLALEPGPWVGAASTVQWNESGQEGALARVLLPDVDEARRALRNPRLAVSPFHEVHSFDSGARVLRVGVGGQVVDSGRWVELYHARLGEGLVPDPDQPITVRDSDEQNLIELGIAPSAIRALANGMGRFEGPSRTGVASGESQIQDPGPEHAPAATDPRSSQAR